MSRNLTAAEKKKWILENCIDADGDIDLSDLDFSEFDGCVFIRKIKVKGDLHQNNQQVKGFLDQSEQQVQGDLCQDYQTVQGNLHQDYQEVGDCLYQHKQRASKYLYQHSQVAKEVVQNIKGE